MYAAMKSNPDTIHENHFLLKAIDFKQGRNKYFTKIWAIQPPLKTIYMTKTDWACTLHLGYNILLYIINFACLFKFNDIRARKVLFCLSSRNAGSWINIVYDPSVHGLCRIFH